MDLKKDKIFELKLYFFFHVSGHSAPASASTESKGQELLIAKSTSAKEELEQQQLQVPKKANSLPNLKKLGDEDCSTLLHACVGLMGLPVDAYALNAILRLLLRLTRTFDYAVIFAQMGGVKMLLDLTQASSFSGFFSLVIKGFFHHHFRSRPKIKKTRDIK